MNSEFRLFDLLDGFSSHQDGVNFIAKVINKKSSKLSITINNYHEIFIDANGNEINPRKSDVYYGLNPKVSSSFIIDLIKKGIFHKEESFQKFLNKYPTYFLMHQKDGCYTYPLYAKTLLRAASHYGFILELSVDQKIKDDLINIIKLHDEELAINEDTNHLIIKGHCTDAALNHMNNLGLKFDKATHKLTLNGTMTIHDALMYHLDIKLLDSHVHYSGVLPRLRKISCSKKDFSNIDVDQYIMHVERTTFFTVDALDSYSSDKHPYMNKYIDVLDKFYKAEDSLINDLHTQLSSGEDSVGAVNDYLIASKNTHIIGVTANLVTSDNHLIIAQRSEKSIDKYQLYPSVNGQSEFYNYNVDFYNLSVHEDMPTLIWDSHVRKDFLSELDRETYAELYIKKFEHEWNFIGVSVLGIRDQSKRSTSRRLHFNVLAENRTVDNLLEITKHLENAAEKFESRKYFAVKVNTYNNLMSYSIQKLWQFVKISYKSKGIIAFVLSLILFFLNLSVLKTNTSLSKINTLTNLFFSLIVAIVSVVDMIKLTKDYKKTKKIKKKIDLIHASNIGNDFNNLVQITLSKLKKFDHQVRFHPMSYLMYYEYYKQIGENKK
jgi:hypothetical protein